MTARLRSHGGEATRRQRNAADPGHSAWVAASAGTGKTKVLSDRVLNLLLEGAAPQRLLCLTFTRAAAAEMATRLSSTLAAWGSQPEPELVRALAELGGEVPSGERVRAARRLFARVLDTPGGLRIQTIHAFCQSLLARFPLEAGVAPHFRLADEATAPELLAEARAAVLAAAQSGRRPDLAAALADATVEAGEEDFAELVGRLVLERARFERALAKHGGLAGMLARLYQVLAVDPGDCMEGALARACEDGAFDAPALRRAAGAMLEGSRAEQRRGAVIADWLARPQARVDGLGAYRAIFLTTLGGTRRRLLTQATAARVPEAQAALGAEAVRLRLLRDLCGRIAVARATAALHRLAFAILNDYRRIKDERALLDYDDLVLAASGLLAQPGIAPWVLYKLDGGIDHILIDEAQDTNPEQWQIVVALAQEFFAGEGARSNNRTIFAVGDAKQSIFSFQRADPRAFERMRQHFAERAAAAQRGFVTVPLSHSFRSSPAVLQAVDAVFARGPAREGVVGAAEWLEHQPTRLGAAGLVEQWPLPPLPDRTLSEPWEPPVGRRERVAPRARLAQLIARRIRAMTDGGERLASRGRPVRPGDIMVLVRRRGPFVDLLVRALKVLDVPVAGVDRMVLMEQIAIQDLVAFGRVLLHPEDDLTLATVLKSPLVGFDEDQLFRLAQPRRGSLWSELAGRAAEEPAFAQAHELLARFLGLADHARPYELYADLLGARGGRRRLLARLGPEVGDPIEEFLNRALAYERDHAASLEGFLAWLGGGGIEVKRELDQTPAGQGAVRILTVHGAKGLQAPIVFLPDTTKPPAPRRPLLWPAGHDLCLWVPAKAQDGEVAATARAEADKADAEEECRLLYVAMTRAEDRLVVCGWPDRNGAAADGSWYAFVAAGLGGVAERVAFDFTGEGGWAGPGFRLASPQTAAAEPDGTILPAADTAAPPSWMTAPAPAEPDPPAPLAPSRPAGEEPPARSPFGDDGGEGVRRGRLLHRLLETLPTLAADRREGACRRFLAVAAADLAEPERADLAAEALAVLADPAFAGLWGPGSLAEVPVVGRIGNAVIAGRIDRLVVEGARVTILDYKGNRPPPATVAAVPAAYIAQMAAYRAALAQIYPGRTIRCALLWTDGPRLMELPDELFNRASP